MLKHIAQSSLVKLFGFPATLIHGDPLVLDRWLWLKRRLPKTANGESLIDVGCGSGAFTIGAALRGYESLGLSWDSRNQKVATERAKICSADGARFDVYDIRNLGDRMDLREKFDIAICLEAIEHILDDRKLMRDIATCLKPGGRLLLTTPNFYYRDITDESGPFSQVEDGGHVRRGYTRAMLLDLCQEAGLMCNEIDYCSGFLSQKVCFMLRKIATVNHLLGWLSTLPLRIFPPILDGVVTRAIRWPYYSICIEAYKPRFARS